MGEEARGLDLKREDVPKIEEPTKLAEQVPTAEQVIAQVADRFAEDVELSKKRLGALLPTTEEIAEKEVLDKALRRDLSDATETLTRNIPGLQRIRRIHSDEGSDDAPSRVIKQKKSSMAAILAGLPRIRSDGGDNATPHVPKEQPNNPTEILGRVVSAESTLPERKLKRTPEQNMADGTVPSPLPTNSNSEAPTPPENITPSSGDAGAPPPPPEGPSGEPGSSEPEPEPGPERAPTTPEASTESTSVKTEKTEKPLGWWQSIRIKLDKYIKPDGNGGAGKPPPPPEGPSDGPGSSEPEPEPGPENTPTPGSSGESTNVNTEKTEKPLSRKQKIKIGMIGLGELMGVRKPGSKFIAQQIELGVMTKKDIKGLKVVQKKVDKYDEKSLEILGRTKRIKAKLDRLIKERDQAQKEYVAYEEKAPLARVFSLNPKRRFQKLRGQVDSAQGQFDAAQTELTRSSNKLEKWKSERIGRVDNFTDTVSEYLRPIENKIIETQKIIDDNKKIISQHEQIIGEIRSRIAEVNDETRKNLEENIIIFEEEISAAKDKIKESEKSLLPLINKANRYKDRIAAFERLNKKVVYSHEKRAERVVPNKEDIKIDTLKVPSTSNYRSGTISSGTERIESDDMVSSASNNGNSENPDNGFFSKVFSWLFNPTKWFK